MSQKLIVAKLGGTSVSNFHTMDCSANLILSKNNTKLVVLSASAGVTNLLIKLAEGLNFKFRIELFKKLELIQYSIINFLKQNNIIKIKINNILNNIIMLSELAEKKPSKILTDDLVSYGEIMSTLIFVEVLKEKKINIKWFDVRNILITNDNFGKAEPNLSLLAKKANTLLKPLINKNIIITQGFIGKDQYGRTTTLGRGGSDYTATLLGEALKADQIDIWTDVPGIYTTDPRIVCNAKRINEITFEEAAEMANFGAKILHPATLFPASRSDIPVFVGSSQNSIDGGTLVCNKTQNLPLFRALTLRRYQTLLILHNLYMLHERGFLAKVFNILSKHQLSVDLITTSEVNIALTLDNTGSTSNNTNKNLITKPLLTELSLLGEIKVENNLSLIALIGNNLSKACGIGKEVFGVLENFNLRLICYGASSYNLCFLVPANDAETVVKILHKNIFE